MGVLEGPGISNNGLVLFLDKYNKDSYLGEPTTNVLTYSYDLLNTGSWWTYAQNYCENPATNEVPPPVGVDAYTASFDDKLGGGGYFYNYSDQAPQDPSTTYTISIYVKAEQSLTNGITAYTANNSEAGRQYTNYLYFSNQGQMSDSAGSSVIKEPDKNGWIRLEFNPITTPSNTESDSLSFYFTNFAVPPNVNRTHLCAPQMEANSHATNYVNGTRSSTEGWRDISGNSYGHANLHALSYSATKIPGTDRNDFSFDGTDDYCTFNTGTTNMGLPVGNEPRSLCAWFSKNNDSSNNAHKAIFGYGYADYSQACWIEHNYNDVFFYGHGSADLLASGSFNAIVDNQMHYMVMTWDGTTKSLYRDGILQRTDTVALSTPVDTTVRISGGAGGLNSGNIDQVSVYNRALTASQVKQNYDAYKHRYI